ncbi:50S ribosomal protein L6 [Patescibacteria group bacterium]|nr:50S ribosomal protein L6 [Patescibacteria group bacterium]
MSRIGKQPIIIPEKVEVKIEGNNIFVKGPKGELTMEKVTAVNVEVKDKEILVTIPEGSKKEIRSLWGTTRSIIDSLVTGVVEGFKKQLEINGVGFKAEMKGKVLVLNVGFSHQVEYNIPEDITASVEKNIITIEGIDKQRVGQITAEIRSIKKPEPYKGKGIKYIDEVIRRKAGKVAKGAEK